MQQHPRLRYTYEDIMFISPYLGEVRCSDALDEHELVIRNLFVDAAFKNAAQTGDLPLMTAALLRVGRAHEQLWFDELPRKWLQKLMRGTMPPEDGGHGLADDFSVDLTTCIESPSVAHQHSFFRFSHNPVVSSHNFPRRPGSQDVCVTSPRMQYTSTRFQEIIINKSGRNQCSRLVRLP